MEHREHYLQYLHAYANAMVGVLVSPMPDSTGSYAATALGVRAARKTGDFAGLEVFCGLMEDLFCIATKTDAA